MAKRTCTIDGCDAALIARGWCHRHYKRWQTFGAPTGVGDERGPQTKTTAERFWAKVTKTDGCWLWSGANDGQGYGSFYLDRESGRVKAHRAAWLLAGRELLPDHEIDHLCRVTLCVRPEHLDQVRHAVNVERGVSPVAINGRKSYCKQGHPLSGDNLYRTSNGARHCRTCYLASQRRYKAKRKATRLA